MSVAPALRNTIAAAQPWHRLCRRHTFLARSWLRHFECRGDCQSAAFRPAAFRCHSWRAGTTNRDANHTSRPI